MAEDVLIFRVNRNKVVLLLFGSTAFAALGLPLIMQGKTLGWEMSCFFGVGMLVSLLALRPNGVYLKLDKEGFEMGTFFGPIRRKWSDVEDFSVGTTGVSRYIGFSYSKSYQKRKVRRAISSAVIGTEGAVSDVYNRPLEEIYAQLINWKRWYGASSDPLKGAL